MATYQRSFSDTDPLLTDKKGTHNGRLTESSGHFSVNEITDQRSLSVTEPLLPEKKKVHDGGCMKARHSLALLAFLGFFNVYCMRVNVSVALVAMVNSTSSDNTTEIHDDCPNPDNTTHAPVVSQGEFHWDANTQALILGAFFYGYIVTQVPGGWLAERVGGKRLFGYGCLIPALLTLLTPVAARAGVPYLVAVRVMEGMGEGVVTPSMLAMWAVWAPVYERSQLAGFVYSGAQLGTVFAMPITGVLCQHGFAGGWPSVFYVFGALGCVWFVFWMLLAHESPAQHPRISEAERRYIEASLGERKHVSTPWRAMLLCPAVWGIMAAHFANNWGFYSMLTSLPTYMNNILHFELTQNGILSGVPYMVLWLTQMSAGQIADCIRRRGYLSTATTRKLLNSFGLAWPACFLIATSYTGCDHTLAVVLVALGVGGGGFTMAGFMVNHLDIAPHFAGTLMGITNGIATIPGFLGPAVVGLLTNHNQTVERWRLFFYITGGIYLTGLVVFILLAKGHEQPWARTKGHPSFTSTYNQEHIIPAPSSAIPYKQNEDSDDDEEYAPASVAATAGIEDYYDDDDDDRTVSIKMIECSVQTSGREERRNGHIV